MILAIKSQEAVVQITNFIRKTTDNSGFKKVIIGLSGGLDSSVATFLAVKALGKENVLITKLPYNDNQDNNTDLVINLLEIPKMNILTIRIEPVVDLLWKKIENIHNSKFMIHNSTPDKVRLGNIMARVRMTIIYDLAKANNCLVCGTENKSEYLLGYFTLFGDSASDLEPIRHLYKTQVRELAKYLKVPQPIIDKPPTANLWPGQTDENELGFSYSDADQILSLYFDQKLTIEKIMKSGFKKELVEKVISQINKNSFKSELPYQIK